MPHRILSAWSCLQLRHLSRCLKHSLRDLLQPLGPPADEQDQLRDFCRWGEGRKTREAKSRKEGHVTDAVWFSAVSVLRETWVCCRWNPAPQLFHLHLLQRAQPALGWGGVSCLTSVWAGPCPGPDLNEGVTVTLLKGNRERTKISKS